MLTRETSGAVLVVWVECCLRVGLLVSDNLFCRVFSSSSFSSSFSCSFSSSSSFFFLLVARLATASGSLHPLLFALFLVLCRTCPVLKPSAVELAHLVFVATPPRRPALLHRRRGGFARSLATLNACSYVLGIGDRHLDNFLLDTTTG